MKRLGDGNVCHTGERSVFPEAHDAETRHSEGLAAGRHRAVVRRRASICRQLPIVFTIDDPEIRCISSAQEMARCSRTASSMQDSPVRTGLLSTSLATAPRAA